MAKKIDNKMDKKKVHKAHCLGILLVLAGLFIGIGTGMALGNTASGTLIGLGVGFLAAFVSSKMHCCCKNK